MAKSAAEIAYAKAVERVRQVQREGGTAISFNTQDYRALDRIPEGLAGIKGLSWLNFNNTKVKHLDTLAALTGLKFLSLDQTKVGDLSPIEGLDGLHTLSLNQTRISELTALATQTELEALNFSETDVSNLAPLAALTKLRRLYFDKTEISDLRPINLARFDGINTWDGLRFSDTPATRLDPELERLAAIGNDKERTQQTLAYLKTLPPWPEPLPWLAPEVSVEEATFDPKAATDHPAPEKGILATKEQISSLLRHAIVTRVTARQLAGQIETALHGVQTEADSNQLPAILQEMAEVAEVLRHIAPEAEPVTAPLEAAKLRLRIAQLEAALEKLGRQLQDEQKARQAAEILAKKDGFLQSYKKSAGTSLGVASVTLVTVGIPAAAVYFLGVENPIVQSVLTVLGRLPKQ